MSSWYQPPVFVPMKYVPASKEAETHAKQVLRLRAAAHGQIQGPYAGGLTNHWCLHLQTGEEESVRIDAVPDLQQHATTIPGGFKADVLVSELHYVVSKNASRVVSLAVSQGLTVGHILDCIVQFGRDKYEFNAAGAGCRKWMKDTLALLEQQAWLSSEEVQAATADIARLWPDGTLLEVGGGQYYDQ